MRHLVAAALVLVLAAAAWGVDNLIIPGVRVGPAHLGQSLEDLTRHLGAGKPYRSKNYTNLLYTGFTVVVGNDANPKVLSVVVTDPPFHMQNGIGIGTPRGKVIKLLGQPNQIQQMSGLTGGMIQESMNFKRLGLSLALAKSRVVQISIYPKK